MSGLDEKGLVDRITDYLASGGLFNPEMANHEAVRDLLIDCRDVLASATPADVGEEPVEALIERLNFLRMEGGAFSTDAVGLNKALRMLSVREDAIRKAATATALARVAKERDEARATLDEVCLSNRQEWQRATSAEAKLAEALARLETVEAKTGERCAKVGALVSALEFASERYADERHGGLDTKAMNQAIVARNEARKALMDAINNLEPRHD